MRVKIFSILAVLCLATLTQPPLAQSQDAPKKRHPSYQLMGRDAPPKDSPLNPNFVVAEEAHMTESGFWRSSYINETLVGLTAADIDNDGRNELVYISKRNIYVGRIGDKKLAQLAKYTIPLTETMLSVDVLDLTGDGKMEVIVSAINDNYKASSTIFDFTGSELVPTATRIPWYLRVVGGPGGYFMAGQKSGSDARSAYSGSVRRMDFNSSKVSGGSSVGLPPFVNIFSFNIGRLGSGGIQMVAAIKFPSEHIFLFEGNNQAWESREEYGGTMNYIQMNAETDGRYREFLPARILISDIDGDGQNELILAKNDRGGVPFMSGQRGFTSGTMQAFKYSNLSLTPFFRTRTLPGPGVDYKLIDVDNNGIKDLVVAVVTQQGSGMLKEGRSVIVAYELGAPKPTEEDEAKK